MLNVECPVAGGAAVVCEVQVPRERSPTTPTPTQPPSGREPTHGAPGAKPRLHARLLQIALAEIYILKKSEYVVYEVSGSAALVCVSVRGRFRALLPRVHRLLNVVMPLSRSCSPPRWFSHAELCSALT